MENEPEMEAMTINSASITSIMAFNAFFVGSLSIYYLSKRNWSSTDEDNDQIENDDDFIVEVGPAIENTL